MSFSNQNPNCPLKYWQKQSKFGSRLTSKRKPREKERVMCVMNPWLIIEAWRGMGKVCLNTHILFILLPLVVAYIVSSACHRPLVFIKNTQLMPIHCPPCAAHFPLGSARNKRPTDLQGAGCRRRPVKPSEFDYCEFRWGQNRNHNHNQNYRTVFY